MPRLEGSLCAPILRWWIRHNPTYLCSAALMAIGARLTLVSPHTRAGQLGVILMTLGALQFYEWLVAAILVLLHRSRRSPEDEPSLLVVAALFWTGPLAATAEMTARNGKLGLLCAIAVAIVALLELSAIRRQVQLSISSWGRAFAAGCVLLLAATPPLIRIPEQPNGRNELFVYIIWWVLAGLSLLTLPAIRMHAPSRRFLPTPLPNRSDLWFEPTFLAIVLGSTVAQLAAMNYAFFAHARFFYASPLMIVLAIVGFQLMTQIGHANRWLVWLFAVMPAIAIVLSFQGFDPHVPARALGGWRDPVDPLLLGAALAWWYGYARHARSLMLHAGNAALAIAVWRMLKVSAALPSGQIVLPGGDGRELLTLLLFGLTAYLLLIAWLRRSRREALAAILTHQAALTLFVWERTAADAFILLVAAGWHFLIALHILSWWPRIQSVLVGINFLLVVSLCYDFTDLVWLARANAAMITIALFLAGKRWHWTGYRRIAVYTAAGESIFFPAHELSSLLGTTEAACIIGAFALLASGAMLSWNKQKLLTLSVETRKGGVTESHASLPGSFES